MNVNPEYRHGAWHWTQPYVLYNYRVEQQQPQQPVWNLDSEVTDLAQARAVEHDLGQHRVANQDTDIKPDDGDNRHGGDCVLMNFKLKRFAFFRQRLK